MKKLLVLLMMVVALGAAAQQSQATKGVIAEYNLAIAKRGDMGARIEFLEKEIATATKAKAKKFQKELTEVKKAYDINERMIATFPKSVTNPVVEQAVNEADKAALQQKMDKQLEGRMGDIERTLNNDVTDPELRRIYQSQQGNTPPPATQPKPQVQQPAQQPVQQPAQQPVQQPARQQQQQSTAAPQQSFRFTLAERYTVQIGGGRSGQAKSYKFSNVLEKTDNAGEAVYCIGDFENAHDAEILCNNIRRNTSYKQAYVVKFAGNTVIGKP